MKAEADGHAVIAGRDAHADGQAAVGQRRLVVNGVGEREAVECRAERRVPGQPGPDPAGAGVDNGPAHQGRDDAVDWQAVAVDGDHGLIVGQPCGERPDRVFAVGEPVCPRVQERDPHRLASRRILGDALVLRDQVHGAPRQARAEHAGAGHELGAQLRARVGDRDGLEAPLR